VHALLVAHALALQPRHRAGHHRVVGTEARGRQGGEEQRGLDRGGVPAPVAVVERLEQRERAGGKPPRDLAGR
jgi:hypothetical protein